MFYLQPGSCQFLLKMNQAALLLVQESSKNSTRWSLYLGELDAERGDLDLPQPPEGLQSDGRGAAGQELDQRQEAEVIIRDEELQQDVQRTGENTVRNGHGNPQEPALKHIHDGRWSSYRSSDRRWSRCDDESGGQRFPFEDEGQVRLLRTAATHRCWTETRKEREEARQRAPSR